MAHQFQTGTQLCKTKICTHVRTRLRASVSVSDTADKSTGTGAVNQSKMFIFISLMIRIDPLHTDTDMFSTNIHLFVSWSIHSDTCNSHQWNPPPSSPHTQLGLPNSHQAKGHNYPACLWHSCLRVRREAVPPPPLLPSFACTHAHVFMRGWLKKMKMVTQLMLILVS